MRQFLTLESGNFVSSAMRKNYDLAMEGSDKLVRPAPCHTCEYIAETVAEIHWHEDRNPGHECCPDHEPIVSPVALCAKCGNRLTNGGDCLTSNCDASPSDGRMFAEPDPVEVADDICKGLGVPT